MVLHARHGIIWHYHQHLAPLVKPLGSSSHGDVALARWERSQHGHAQQDGESSISSHRRHGVKLLAAKLAKILGIV